MYKLVPEHINEVINFTRDNQNKLSSLNIGKIKLINDWLNEKTLNSKVKINDNLTIDAEMIYILKKDFNKFPEFIQFNEIYDFFFCEDCNLISLKGGPRYVRGDFYIKNNKLTLNCLKDFPKHVGGDIQCYKNTSKFTGDQIRKYCDVGGNIYV